VTSSDGARRHEVDVVVVGGGPSGLAAASWLGRYRRSVVVLDSREYRSGMVERSHGYLGRDPQKPIELIERGREEVLAYPTVEIRHREVQGLRQRDDGLFEVDDDLLAHRLLLATGVKDAFPDIGGFHEHYGASVFHCPACDGYEARDRHVVALGWDAHLVGFATTLTNWACSVTVVTNGLRFRGDDSCRTQLSDNGITLLERTRSASSASAVTCGGRARRRRGAPGVDGDVLAGARPAHRPRRGARRRARRRRLRRRRRPAVRRASRACTRPAT
jgi:thioredoxin reductase